MSLAVSCWGHDQFLENMFIAWQHLLAGLRRVSMSEPCGLEMAIQQWFLAKVFPQWRKSTITTITTRLTGQDLGVEALAHNMDMQQEVIEMGKGPQ